LAEDLWLVEVDPSQVDQVVVNLAVNARDAMPAGGTLTIETANVVLDEAYVAASVDAQPGEHVMLAVSDTGVGMDEEVKVHLFEPFFTTKQRGQGTGLGLSTVFGIVRQNGGHIRIHSEVGLGTTVRIYLPSTRRVEALPRALSRSLPSATERLVQGTETVLVVEDEADVRNLAVQILQSCGYRVLAASNGPEALQISEQHGDTIHLLLTDVVMPHMNGKELADKLEHQRPALRVLYMSGYADDAIMQHGLLTAGVAFLAKPLTVESLTQKVRAVLDGRL
jgi:two-component system cell cycle sensor histidine kinase/response regulator CckA